MSSASACLRLDELPNLFFHKFLMDGTPLSMVYSLAFTKCGTKLVALVGSGVKVWKWIHIHDLLAFPSRTPSFLDIAIQLPTNVGIGQMKISKNNENLFIAVGPYIASYRTSDLQCNGTQMLGEENVTTFAVNTLKNSQVFAGTDHSNILLFKNTGNVFGFPHTFEPCADPTKKTIGLAVYNGPGVPLMASLTSDRKFCVRILWEKSKNVWEVIHDREIAEVSLLHQLEETINFEFHTNNPYLTVVLPTHIFIIEALSLRVLNQITLPSYYGGIFSAVCSFDYSYIFLACMNGVLQIDGDSLTIHAFLDYLTLPSLDGVYIISLAPHPFRRDWVAAGYNNGMVMILKVKDSHRRD